MAGFTSHNRPAHYGESGVFGGNSGFHHKCVLVAMNQQRDCSEWSKRDVSPTAVFSWSLENNGAPPSHVVAL